MDTVPASGKGAADGSGTAARVSVWLLERVGETVGVRDDVTDGDFDGVRELDGEDDAVRVCDGLSDGVTVADGECEGVPETELVKEGVPEVERVPEGVPETELVSEGVPVLEGVSEAVGVRERVGVCVGVTVPVCDGDAPRESVAVSDAVCEGDGVSELDALRVDDVLDVSERVFDSLGVIVDVRVDDHDSDGDAPARLASTSSARRIAARAAIRLAAGGTADAAGLLY